MPARKTRKKKEVHCDVGGEHSVANADCVLIDQHLEELADINISDTVLKLRVCGFNGVIVLLLEEKTRHARLVRDDLSRSVAEVDMITHECTF